MRKLSMNAAGVVAVLCAALVVLALAPSARAAATAPTVSLNSVTNISDSAATLRGDVNPQGAATQYQYLYGTTPSLGSYSPAAPTQVGSGKSVTGTANVAENRTLTGLTPGTTYYYELWAQNADGTHTSQVATFTTTAAAAVTTEPAIGVGRYGATLVGTLNPTSQATTYYFQYGTTATYGLQTTPLTLPASSTPSTVAVGVAGLQPGAVFHYRLVATHGTTSGTTYPISSVTTSTAVAGDMTFETLPWPRPATGVFFGIGPIRTRHAPVTYHVIGHIGLAYTVARAQGCTGTVIVRFYQGTRQIAATDATVGPACGFRTSVRIKHVIRVIGPAHITAQARFQGNTWAAPSSVKRLALTVG